MVDSIPQTEKEGRQNKLYLLLEKCLNEDL